MKVPILNGSLLCTCPIATALTAIPVATCFENFGQVVKIILQRRKNSGTIQTITIGNMVGETDLLATWTALLAASDDTKIVITPKIGGPAFEPGEAVEWGGGNDTPGGEIVVLRKDPTKFEGNFQRQPQHVIAAVKNIGCEDGGIGAFLVNESGQIAGYGDTNDGSPTTVRGFPITGFVVGDKKIGGREELDSNYVKFVLEEDWSDNFTIITLDDGDASEDI